MSESVLSEGEAQTWAATFDTDTKGWLGGMGLDKLPAEEALPKLVTGYRNAESKLGVPADQILRLPKDDDAEGFMQIMAKLGRPESPDQYELPVPEGDDGAFAKQAATWFHELGLPKKQAAGLAEKWNQYAQSQIEAQAKDAENAAKADVEALKAEWKGEEFNKNVELARRVRKSAGVTDDEAIAIERALGVKRAAMVFAGLGKGLGEARFLDSGGNGSFGMSPEAARAKIADLQKDSAWASAYLAGDAAKKEEFTRLLKIANPEAGSP